MMKFEHGIEYARKLDMMDSLRHFKDQFYTHEQELYMDGNSLGLCSKPAESSLLEAFKVWKRDGIRIWGTDSGKYFNFSRRLSEKLSPLIGASPEEIVVMGSITSNIHQAIATFYKPTKSRYKIVMDVLNFPTDLYAVKSLIELLGRNIEETLVLVESRDGRTLQTKDILKAFDDDVALVLLPSVLYRSSQLLEMESITAAAHEKGILIGWDLAHSIGVVPHDFNSINPDFAVWCSYKYLSGGPGATAGLYINKRHFNKSAGLKGWFGNRDDIQFQLNPNFEQDVDANGFLIGTPHILSMAPLDAVLDMFTQAGIHAIREKSLNLTAYLMYLIDSRLSNYDYTIGNPREDSHRGGHVSLEHPEAYRISLALRDNGVIPDYREPNVIRLAPVPLYVSFEDVYHLVEILEKITSQKVYEHYSHEHVTVL